MPAYERLNARDHGALRLLPWRRWPGHFVQIVAAEFAAVAAEYPILFARHPDTGAFYPGAVLGFRQGENIRGDANGALPHYLPLDVQRQGFYLADDGGILVDRDHPRLSLDEGEPLFDLHGQPGEALRQIQAIMGQLKTGLARTEAFIARLVSHRLIEPISISLSFDDGERVTLEELSSIGLDTLSELEDGAALALFRQGDLQLAYAAIGSLKQIGSLAQRRNERLAEPA